LAATDLQDHLLVANNDLERLQRLLDDASQALMRHFTYASEHMDAALVHLEPAAGRAADHPRGAPDAGHGHHRAAVPGHGHAADRPHHAPAAQLRRPPGARRHGRRRGRCAVVEEAPLRPNPVTQDEMDAGSIELF
jgi:hypothetical protein